MTNATTMTQEQVLEMVKALDPKNFEYIVKNHRISGIIEDVVRTSGKLQIVEMYLENLKEEVENFSKRNLVPSNVEVGMGATQILWSDRRAFTIIKKTAKSITIQRDNATKTFKPEFVTGGFAGHCTNNDDQTYEYEANPNGETVTYRWSEKHQRYQNNYSSLIGGRHEKYDYNF